MHGISAIIAAVLLLLISISLASLAYVWLSGTFVSVSGSGQTQVENAGSLLKAGMKIESVSGDKVYIRNTGDSDLTDIAVYVDELPKKIITMTIDGTGVSAIPKGKIGILKINLSDISMDSSLLKITTGQNVKQTVAIEPNANLEKNGGAESGAAAPSNWNVYISYGTNSLTRDSAEKYSGSYSAKSTPLTLDANGRCTYNVHSTSSGGYSAGSSITVKPSTQYKFSAWIKTSQPLIAMRVLTWKTSDHGSTGRYWPSSGLDATVPNSNWNKYEMTFITQADADIASPYFAINVYAPGLNIPYYIDDVYFAEGFKMK